ncbi:MAG: sodium:proton exchanger [Planctomycetales bacterium 71-10]|nr:MAG: sodium:proton exchanger [Planctomycetales bacterium 71-10]
MRGLASFLMPAIAATVPGLVLRFAGLHAPAPLAAILFGVAILGAGFLLSWAAEAAETHISRGLAIAGLALITVLPEYAIDIYYAFEAGRYPESDYAQFAAANMTGANRLLIGVAWPLIVLLSYWRGRGRGVALRGSNAAEITFLAIATLYSFVITLRGSIGLVDAALLVAIFAAYLRRVARLPGEEGEEGEESAVGPVAAILGLPHRRQHRVIGAMAAYAAVVILASAEPFAESLIAAGRTLGLNQFLLIQWVAPLASEAPQVVITILFTLRGMPTYALGALVSDKINQWTLLVGMLPLAYSVGAGHVGSLLLDARQHEEFFLTAAQSLFGVALLLRLRLSVAGAASLLGLFLLQLGLGFAFRDDEAREIQVLTAVAWVYLVLAVGLVLSNLRHFQRVARLGLLTTPSDEGTAHPRPGAT